MTRRLQQLWVVLLLGAMSIASAVTLIAMSTSRGQPMTVSDWVQQLAAVDATRRREAAKALKEMGPQARAAIPDLRLLLDDKDVSVRITAATALWKIDRQAEPLLLVAWELFGKHSFLGLTGQGPHPNRVAELDDPAVSAAVSDALQEVHTTLVGTIQFNLFKDPALSMVPASNEDLEAGVAAMAQALENEHAGVRRMAIFAFCFLPVGENSQLAVPALIRSFKDADLWTRALALGALQKFGPTARKAVPVLKEVLAERTTNVATGIIAAYSVPPQFSVVIPPIIQHVEMEDKMCECAARTLMQIDPKAAPRTAFR